jgi:hypothetical protein
MMAGRAIAAIRSAFADRQPVLVFLAGPNGAGKSTFFRNFLEPHLAGRLPFVNADEIGKALRETGVAGSGMDYDRVAFDETEALRWSFLEQGLPFCTETVFSDPGGAKLDFLRRARKAGYAPATLPSHAREPPSRARDRERRLPVRQSSDLQPFPEL